MGIIEEHIKLTNEIASGKLTKSLVLKEIDRIEQEYGEEAFGAYSVKKKTAPWTAKDLEDLEVQSASGACSKDFYIYMAEVSDYVHKDVKISGTLGFVGKYVRKLAEHWLIVLVVVGIIVALVFFLCNK